VTKYHGSQENEEEAEGKGKEEVRILLTFFHSAILPK
jgi:hypothetical protein